MRIRKKSSPKYNLNDLFTPSQVDIELSVLKTQNLLSNPKVKISKTPTEIDDKMMILKEREKWNVALAFTK